MVVDVLHSITRSFLTQIVTARGKQAPSYLPAKICPC
jgi:hypothetical protein